MVPAFRRNRALTAAVVATLSIGVGVSAAMFNLVDVLLFRPPAHVTNPDRLVEVPFASNFVRYRRLQRQAQSLELAVHTRMQIMLRLGGGPDDPFVRAECVSVNYLQVLDAGLRAFFPTLPDARINRQAHRSDAHRPVGRSRVGRGLCLRFQHPSVVPQEITRRHRREEHPRCAR
jgi:hypothetical protein